MSNESDLLGLGGVEGSGKSQPPSSDEPGPIAAAVPPAPPEEPVGLTEAELQLVTIPPTFLRVHSRSATFGELWNDVRSPAVVITWIAKLLRIDLPGSVNDPNVVSLGTCAVDETAIPDDALLRMAPARAELERLGFALIARHAIVDLYHTNRHYILTFLHRDGLACARIHHRREGSTSRPKLHDHCDILSAFGDDDAFLWTTSARALLLAPPQCQIHHVLGGSPTLLWDRHQQLLRAARAHASVVVHFPNAEAALDTLVERHHATVRDFHLARGLFSIMNPVELDQQRAIASTVERTHGTGFPHPEVLAEIERLQTKRTSWTAAILILVVSIALFTGLGQAQWDWEFVAILLGVLFVHELGHYVAMRLFGYRNLKMFFIPLFGAAVSGEHYTAPGWKKAIVALMGPVPSIILGCALGIVGWIKGSDMMMTAAMITLILNALNLVPVLPLDGGRVAHALLFCRHVALDVGFRAIAGLALALGGFAVGDRFLGALGIFMLIGIPINYTLARVAAEVRALNLPPPGEDQRLSLDMAAAIIDRLKTPLLRKASHKQLAQHALLVYEHVNARPPGWLATIGLGAVHGTSLVVALVGIMLLTVLRTTDLGGFLSMAATAPEHQVDPASITRWSQVTSDPLPTDAQQTIVATFPSYADAAAALSAVRDGLIGNATATLFGQTVLVAIPADDDALRERMFALLSARSDDTFVTSSHSRASLTVMCVAPSEAVATSIEKEIQDYMRLPHPARIVPPWCPDDARTDAQRAAHARARRTWFRLQEAGSGAWSDPRMEALDVAHERARRSGDDTAVSRALDERTRLFESIRLEDIATLRSSDNIDVELVAAYERILNDAGDDYLEFQKATATLVEHFGAVGTAPDEPNAHAGRVAAMNGIVFREGLFVRINWLTLNSPADGAPALIAWLDEQGCIDFKYDIAATGSYYDEIEDFEGD